MSLSRIKNRIICHKQEGKLKANTMEVKPLVLARYAWSKGEVAGARE